MKSHFIKSNCSRRAETSADDSEMPTPMPVYFCCFSQFISHDNHERISHSQSGGRACVWMAAMGTPLTRNILEGNKFEEELGERKRRRVSSSEKEISHSRTLVDAAVTQRSILRNACSSVASVFLFMTSSVDNSL